MLSFIKFIDKHNKEILISLSFFFIVFSFINVFYPHIFRAVSLFYFIPVILYSLVNRKFGLISAFISILVILFVTTFHNGVISDQPIYIYNLGGGSGLIIAAWAFGTLRDLIFEGMRKEEIITSSREKYKKVVDNIREGMIIVDNDGVVRFLNKACASILGIKVTDLDFDIRSLLNIENKRKLSDELEMRKNGRSSDYSLEYDHPKRGKRKIFIAATPFTDEKGYVNGSIGFLSDITESVEKAARIETLQLRNEYLFSEMQHRVGNSLAMMKAFLNLYLSAETKNGIDGLEKIDDIFDTMASINARFFQNFSNQTVFMKSYFNDIILNFIHKYRSKLDTIITGPDGLDVHIDVALPLGMLVTIIITNIIKETSRKNAEGDLEVTVNSNDNRNVFELKLNNLRTENKYKLYRKNNFESEIIEVLLNQIRGNIIIDNKTNTLKIEF